MASPRQEESKELAELQQLLKRLENNTSWYRTILETAGEGIISFDDEGTILSFNPAAEQIFGLGADELVGRDISLLLPELELKKDGRHQVSGRRGDGSLFPTDCAISTMSFDGHTIYTAILHDVTKQRAIEADRNQAYEQIRQILDTSADGMRIIDRDFIVFQANRTFARLAGLDMAQVIGKKCYEMFPGAACNTPDCPVTRIFSGTGHYRAEVLKRRTDGSWIPCLLSANPYISDTGEVLGVIEDFRDISELKALNEALRTARDKENRASEAKSLFIANVSHELRTPLNSIQGMAYLLACSPLQPEQAKQLQAISLAADRLLELVNDILDFSNLDCGKLQLTHHPFHFDEIAQTLAADFTRQCRQKGLEFIMTVSPQAPRTLIGDGHRLQQVLDHLLANAVKFTSTGHVSMESSLAHAEGEDVVLSFRVEDSGKGMDQKELQLALESFSQVDGSSTRSQGGIGLGLSLVNKLIGIMGGELHIDSMPGQGAIFSFTAAFRLPTGNESTVDPASSRVDEKQPLCHPGPETAEVTSYQAPTGTAGFEEDSAGELPPDLVRQLTDMLRNADIRSKQVLAELARQPHGPEMAEKLRQLEIAVAGYDFERAEELLAKLAPQGVNSL